MTPHLTLLLVYLFRVRAHSTASPSKQGTSSHSARAAAAKAQPAAGAGAGAGVGVGSVTASAQGLSSSTAKPASAAAAVASTSAGTSAAHMSIAGCTYYKHGKKILQGKSHCSSSTCVLRLTSACAAMTGVSQTLALDMLFHRVYKVSISNCSYNNSTLPL